MIISIELLMLSYFSRHLKNIFLFKNLLRTDFFTWHLSNQAPYLMREVTLKDVLARAHKTGDDEIQRIADLVTSHLDSLKESDNQYKEEEFHKNVKEVFVLFPLYVTEQLK